MMRPPACWNIVLVHGAALICAAGFIQSSSAATDLRLAYDVGRNPPKSTADLNARAAADINAPLRLEYELKAHVERMTQTTQELRAIIDAMPGPSLHATDVPPPPRQKFASPLAETIARLNDVDHLIADITRIIEAMPVAVPAAPVKPAVVPTPGTVAPVATPAATPIANPAPVAVISPPAAAAPVPAPIKQAAKPAPVASVAKPTPKPAPPPQPSQAPDIPLSPSTMRAIWLACGGIIAALLARQLRKMYLRRRPSVKDHAASIGAPPIRDEALELADVMSSMGMADGAADALVQQIQANPRQSLMHWLKLLDVYRQTGKREQYEKTTAEMRKAFNVEAGKWDNKGAGSEADKSLENYPHIATQLKKLWPTQACVDFLLSLLADNRDGKRAGFPLPVVEEIVLLLAMLRSEP